MGNIFTANQNIWTFSSSNVQVFAATEEENDEVEDPVERMLKKTGCIELHYSVQECIAETKDWRQCQQQVQEFKECMKRHEKNRRRVRI